MKPGKWPEHPVEDLKVGDVVRYPTTYRGIVRGTVTFITHDTDPATVYFGTDWCKITEVSEDKD